MHGMILDLCAKVAPRLSLSVPHTLRLTVPALLARARQEERGPVWIHYAYPLGEAGVLA